jgi:hypothetical protein
VQATIFRPRERPEPRGIDLAQYRLEAQAHRFRRWQQAMRKSMKMALRRTAIATSTVAFATLLSLNWSQERGISLSVESAQARVYGRYVNRSYVTGRPTLVPRYYGGW